MTKLYLRCFDISNPTNEAALCSLLPSLIDLRLELFIFDSVSAPAKFFGLCTNLETWIVSCKFKEPTAGDQCDIATFQMPPHTLSLKFFSWCPLQHQIEGVNDDDDDYQEDYENDHEDYDSEGGSVTSDAASATSEELNAKEELFPLALAQLMQKERVSIRWFQLVMLTSMPNWYGTDGVEKLFAQQAENMTALTIQVDEMTPIRRDQLAVTVSLAELTQLQVVAFRGILGSLDKLSWALKHLETIQSKQLRYIVLHSFGEVLNEDLEMAKYSRDFQEHIISQDLILCIEEDRWRHMDEHKDTVYRYGQHHFPRLYAEKRIAYISIGNLFHSERGYFDPIPLSMDYFSHIEATAYFP